MASLLIFPEGALACSHGQARDAHAARGVCLVPLPMSCRGCRLLDERHERACPRCCSLPLLLQAPPLHLCPCLWLTCPVA
jgi:hypothetical protein